MYISHTLGCITEYVSLLCVHRWVCLPTVGTPVGILLSLCITVGILLPLCITVVPLSPCVQRWVPLSSCVQRWVTPEVYNGGYSLRCIMVGYSLRCTMVVIPPWWVIPSGFNPGWVIPSGFNPGVRNLLFMPGNAAQRAVLHKGVLFLHGGYSRVVIPVMLKP